MLGSTDRWVMLLFLFSDLTDKCTEASERLGRVSEASEVSVPGAKRKRTQKKPPNKNQNKQTNKKPKTIIYIDNITMKCLKIFKSMIKD